MRTDTMPKDGVALRLRAQRARVECGQMGQALEVTLAETRALLAQLQQIHADDVWRHVAPAIEITAATPADQALVHAELPDCEKRALDRLRGILGEFPLETQIAMLKALTLLTVILLHDETHPPVTLSA